ncbi:hypothetical protein [Psychrobium sp. nBUS_13]|uniref:hypothetical protein n=1 Tax=Psychrobium sp. nBUS_13 TaxID=3395319 RepID=UPI003EB8EA3E
MFSISAQPQKVSHCHCTMWQKQHGAAFATCARFKRADIYYKALNRCRVIALALMLNENFACCVEVTLSGLCQI